MNKPVLKQQIKKWEESLKYSDPEKIEFNTLLKEIEFEGKIVLDVGCGIGRLTLPISKYARKVVGVDSKKSVIQYCNEHKKKKNIKYVHKNILEFKEKNFDVVILAQPVYKNFNRILEAIHYSLKEKGKLVIIKWIDKGNQYNELLTPFWNKNKEVMKEVENFSKNFKKNIKKNFKIKKEILIRSYDSYPNKEVLVKNIIQDSPIRFKESDKTKLNNLIRKYDFSKINITMKLYVLEKV